VEKTVDLSSERNGLDLSRLTFKFAKTMPETPHWYVVRTRANEADYVALFHTIQEKGVDERFGKRRYRYWRPGDGFKYWAMTADVTQSHVINRAKIDVSRDLKDETDDARLDAMTDADIAQAADDPDAPPLDLDWSKARLVPPLGKAIVTLRLDSDLLEWFRAQGKGYQTRINQVLRTFYEAKRERSERER
jgi:uncharacterized protein (DUF4415 family)